LEYLNEFQRWCARWGDLASVAGVILSLIGFAATIWGVWRSKDAAEAAEQAAIETRNSIAHYDAIADLTSSLAIMGEIKRLQRLGVWAVLPDRYSELRRHLVAIKTSRMQLDDHQLQTIQSTIEAFAQLEKRVERAVLSNEVPANPAKLNDIVSGKIDEVHAVLLSVQRILRSVSDE
jgi:hypothetical protein